MAFDHVLVPSDFTLIRDTIILKQPLQNSFIIKYVRRETTS